MTNRSIRPLQPDEERALALFAKENGRRWKATLSEVYWYNARPWQCAEMPDAGPILQGLRNDPRWGNAGLARFKLPKEAA